MTTITPRYKLILTYDVLSTKQGIYSQFILGDFIPGLQALDIYLTSVYQTVVGDYPSRQAEFVSESLQIMQQGLKSDRFIELENTLKSYTTNYNRKVVQYRSGFQF